MAKEKEKSTLAESLPDSTFNRLNQIDVSEKTEQKNGLTYLSWAWAFAEIFKRYPDAEYSIREFENTYVAPDGSVLWKSVEPFLFNYHLGYLVQTSVTIDGKTKTMQLPVMDSANKAQKHEAYTYTGWEYVKVQGQAQKQRKAVEKKVEPATMFDINTTIMRCLVKNFAMHGLGLYIYAGEDIPEDISSLIKSAVEEVAKTVPQEVPAEKQESKPETKTTTKRTSKSKASITELPDDSGVLPSQPLAEIEIAKKASVSGDYTQRFKAAKSHDEVFEVLDELNAAKVLATGTMHMGWKFKTIAELKEKMRAASLEAVILRLETLMTHYNPN